jgi:NAD+--asparagine ADP-ribosyltransferase
VLISYPKATGRDDALATATRAAKARLPGVGILDSDRFSSLHPGYFVVFSGIYGSQARAEAALRTARASGFSGAYARPVSR